jgi:hypothetical protein
MTNDVVSRAETSSRDRSMPQSSAAFDAARARYNQAAATLAGTQTEITKQNELIYGDVSAEDRIAAIEKKVGLLGREKDQQRTVDGLTAEMQRLAPPEEVGPPIMVVYIHSPVANSTEHSFWTMKQYNTRVQEILEER